MGKLRDGHVVIESITGGVMDKVIRVVRRNQINGYPEKGSLLHNGEKVYIVLGCNDRIALVKEKQA